MLFVIAYDVAAPLNMDCIHEVVAAPVIAVAKPIN